ncbi:MAG: hypothetical protein KDA86_14555 [Planctomycetaceae bacterium]|nr:hypothetical protein [Planctomycetaceae bacterium]
MNQVWTPWGLIALLLVLQVAHSHAADPTFDRPHWQARLDKLTASLAAEPDNIELLAARGDAYFFLGQFEDAVRDYDRMVELDASRDTSHWRRGIACFYAGQYEQAAGQFERYHSFDDVDRENGIWRYLCQVKSNGVEAAEAGLLKYKKDDREPFGDVYRLFSGEATPDVILKRINTADLTETEREKRLFYANLYIGLWHAVHDRPGEARLFLRASASNTWAPLAGYGPNYMWHVGRLHNDILEKERND